MKKILLLLITIASMKLAYSQCSTGDITTDPQNPVDSRLSHINERDNGNPRLDWTTQQFDWIFQDPSGNWAIKNPLSPFYQAGDIDLLHLVNTVAPELQDNRPEDGWELIQFKLGQQFSVNSGELVTTNVDIDHPEIILYNKYTGVLRIFVYFNTSLAHQGYQTAYIKLSPLYPNPLNPLNMDKVPALFQHNTKIIQPLNQYKKEALQVTAVNNIKVASGEWLYADFVVSYDPCVCHHDYLKLYLDIDVIKEASIDLTGTLKIDGYVDVANKQGDTKTETILQTFAKANKTGQTIYKSKDIFKSKTASSAAKVGGKKLALKQAAGLAVASKGTAIPFIIGGIIVADFLMMQGDKKQAKSEAENKPYIRSPISLEGDIQMSGGITDIDDAVQAFLEVPGSKQTNATANEHIPMYNKPLGVMTMLEAPKLKYTTYWAPSSLPLRDQFLKLRQFQLYQIPEIVINPASGLELDELKVSIVIDYKSDDYLDSLEVNNEYTPFSWRHKPAVFNTSLRKWGSSSFKWSDFKESESTFNWEKHIPDSLSRVTLGQIPISCLENSSFYLFDEQYELNHSTELTISVRFNAILSVIGEPAAEKVRLVHTYAIPKENIINDNPLESEDLLFFEAINDPESGGFKVLPPGSSGINAYPEKNSFVKDFIGLEDESVGPGQIFAWTNIVLGENVDIMPPFEAHAGEVISAYPENRFMPEVKLKSNSYPDPTCLDPASNYLSTIDLATYCNSSDKYNPVMTKRDLFANEEQQAQEYSFNLYPNPTDNMVNIEVDLIDMATYTIDVLDVSGRAIYNRTASSQEFHNNTWSINTSSLESGIYFVNVRQGANTMTKRLVITR